jgi:uroporphyrinogen-III synthase
MPTKAVLTRPPGQSQALAEALAKHGCASFCFALQRIAPAPDPAPLEAAAAHFHEAGILVFASPNAVRFALPALPARPWAAPAFCVGQGTKKALAAFGVAAEAPAGGADSESLLALPGLAREKVEGRRIFIFRGSEGRPLLAQELARRGGHPEYVPAYAQLKPARDAAYAEFLAGVEGGRFGAIAVFSTGALKNLLEIANGMPEGWQARLKQMRIAASHPRIALAARQAGFADAVAAKDETEMLKAIRLACAKKV